MDLVRMRRLIVTALFSDDKLLDLLVLKGGNALELIHGVVSRGSIDLDFSMATDFADFEDAKMRLFGALRDRLGSAGFVLFDEEFARKPAMPREGQPSWWGGYLLTFKVIERSRYEELAGELDALRREAHVVDPHQRRTFKVDISKYEFCEGKFETEMDYYTVYAYTPEMIAIEKIRAICQQMQEYSLIAPELKRARARDFYDIHEIVRATNVELAAAPDLVRAIFDAKGVDIDLLSRIEAEREFHRPDWPAVEASVGGDLEPFDYYFDFVSEIARALYALRVE